ncbi:DUF3173 family protein [Lapidilactobacillus bayanensis]|nr:DUF3173 family protein [Lapidilactobacillus bayanensis]
MNINAPEQPVFLTMTRADLIKLGYSPSQASRIIKMAKELLLKQGLGWYGKKGVDRVPVEAVDAVLGLKLSQLEGAPSGLSAVKEELS